METFEKVSSSRSSDHKEDKYTTLEKIDFTDIAQAIDGSRSKPMGSSKPIKKDFEDQGKSRSRRFWFW